MNKPKPTSTAPYMFNAQLNYLVDAGYERIYMMADCSVPGVLAHTNETKVSFAIQADACKHFIADQSGVSFEARIGGKVSNLYFPWDAVIGIFPPDKEIFGIPAIHDVWGIEYIAKHRQSTSEQVPEPEKKVEKPRPKLRLVE